MEKIKFASFDTYLDMYSFVAQQPRAKNDVANYLIGQAGKAKKNAYDHVSKAEEGKVSCLSVDGDNLVFDETQFISGITDLCSALGFTASIERKSKKRHTPEDDIASVRDSHSPEYNQMKKKADNATAMEKKKDAEIAALNEKIRLLTNELALAAVKAPKVVDMDSVKTLPSEEFKRDFFLLSSDKLLDVEGLVKKQGQITREFYEPLFSSEKELTTDNYLKRIAKQLFGGNLLRNRLEEQDRFKNVEMALEDGVWVKRKSISPADIETNRLNSINEILAMDDVSNQVKLSLYAFWWDKDEREMLELLRYAGEKDIDANFVIRLLEKPKEYRNYRTLRGLLQQASMASEAHIKRDAALELLAGEWYVEADYGGKPCKFQMLPIDEIESFKEALASNGTDRALAILEELLAIDRSSISVTQSKEPAKKKSKADSSKQISKQIAKPGFLTELESKSGVDMHAQVDEELTNDFEGGVSADAVANEYVEERQFHEKLLYQYHRNKYDGLTKAYNKVIADKVKDARQGLYQTIYLTLTVDADDMADARTTFNSMESAIRSAFVGIGVNGIQGSVMKALNINERMQLLFNLTHGGIDTRYKFNFEDEIEARHDWLNIISPASICFENEQFSINGQVGKVFFVEEYPKSLESDIIAALTKINCTNYISVNNELLDISGFKQEIARKYMAIGMKIENEKQRNRNNNDYLADASAKLLNEKEKLDAFSKQLDTDDDHYFNTTMMIMVITKNEEELAQIEEKLLNAASLKSVKLKSCFGKQKEGLNSVLPIGAQEFKRVANLSSSCLAMLMPFKTQELNDEDGTYYGINQLSLNVIKANKKKLKNHNGLILGQSGSGKSVFAKSEIISTFINFLEDQIIIIDPMAEYAKLASQTDGTVISFDSTKEFYINPMDVNFEGIDYGRLREIISDKTDFILTLLSSCLKRDMTAEEQGVVDAVIEKVYSDNFAMRKRLNGSLDEASEFTVPAYMRNETVAKLKATNLSNEEQIREYSPTLQDVYQGLQDEGGSVALHLAAAMEIFVNGSLNLFNHRTNVDLSNRFIVFDLSGLKENLRITAMLIMMETVRSAIKENSTSGRWTHLYIDEFHELLAVEQVAAFVLKLWKEIRKMSGILNGITQNMSDLLNSENGGKLQAILSNTEYFALLSQSTLDKNKLMQFLPSISPAMFIFVDNADSGTGLLKMGSVCVPFDMRMDKDSEIYRIVNTDGGGGFGI